MPQNEAKCPITSQVEEIGPAANRREHSIVASTASPAKPALHMHLPFSTTSAATSWPVIITVLLVMPTMMLSIMSLTTTEGSTARSASSQAEPAINMQLCRSETVLLVHTDHDAEHHGLTPTKETRRVKHPPAKPAVHATAQAATSATSKPALDMQVPLSTSGASPHNCPSGPYPS